MYAHIYFHISYISGLQILDLQAIRLIARLRSIPHMYVYIYIYAYVHIHMHTYIVIFHIYQGSKFWICKPSDSSRGRGIFIISHISQLVYDQQYVVQVFFSFPHFLILSFYSSLLPTVFHVSHISSFPICPSWYTISNISSRFFSLFLFSFSNIFHISLISSFPICPTCNTISNMSSRSFSSFSRYPIFPYSCFLFPTIFRVSHISSVPIFPRWYMISNMSSRYTCNHICMYTHIHTYVQICIDI